VSTQDRAREAMTAELADAFTTGDRARVQAAAEWLRTTGTPLVDIYEVLLDAARTTAPEFAQTADEHVHRHRVQESLRDLVARLGTSSRLATRGQVLVVVPGGSLHVLGVTALVHVLQDAGWSVVAAPELGLDDLEAQLEQLSDPAGVCLGLNDADAVPQAREVVRRLRARWPRLRVVVGGLASQQLPDLCGAVGATSETRSMRETLAALDDAENPLSPRELSVLTCVARGMSNPDTAAHLGVASATVKTHLDRVYAKLGTSDRTATVALAMRRGWIS
jgi:DNA-binding CsgD family transcriptional regulator/methylmalonyl-CoA mutase cobalamin-binding subunit